MRNYIFYLISLFSLYACGQKEPYLVQEDDVVKLEDSYLQVATVADSLEVPWGMAYVDNKIMFTEIKGKVKLLDLSSGQIKTILSLDHVFHRTTPGLLGIAIQKKANDPFVLLVYTEKKGDNITANLVRYTYRQDTLINPVPLLSVKGGMGHNGSRVLIDEHDIIYWATGDAADNTQAQDSTTLSGKVLRLKMDGSVPADNPIAGSYVYAWGFRNIQGLTQDDTGKIFSAEHGDAIEDEVNLIRPLQNYGWPLIEGKHDTPAELRIADSSHRTEPIKAWTPVIAPAGLAYYNNATIPEWQNSLLLVTLKTQSLRVLKLSENNTAIASQKVYFSNRYGRLRDVLVVPNGDVYITTSNMDWNPQPGFPLQGDDRILRISKTQKQTNNFISEDPLAKPSEFNGELLYKNYCASCHKANGKGVAGNFPALKSAKILENQQAFLQVLLKGTDGKKASDGVQYSQRMASFSFLKDEELAQIINYVQVNFGVRDTVTAAEIKKQR